MKTFTFNTRGKTSNEMGILCISANVFNISKNNFETKEVSGGYSPILLFNEMRDRFKLKIKVVIKGSDIFNTVSQIRQWLMYDHADKPISLSNIKDSYYEGFLEDFDSVSDYNDTHVTCTLVFNCKPLRQLKLGDEGQEGQFTSGQSNFIRALQPCAPSKPTIVISPPNGLNTLTITINSGTSKAQIINLNGIRAIPQGKKLIISSELQECYYIDDNKTLIPCNHLMKGDFPETFNGEFQITGSDIDLSVPVPFVVYPRWRVM